MARPIGIEGPRDRDGIKVIHTSTSEVYGTPRSVPIGEDHALQAQSPYAATKIAADQLALSIVRANQRARPGRAFAPTGEWTAKALASLPSLDELRGTIVGLLQAPATKVARVLQAPACQLARVTSAYATKGKAA